MLSKKAWIPAFAGMTIKMALTPLKDFDYPLPEKLIAHVPAKKRDQSRLMVLHKDTNKIEHKKFSNIVDYLEAGDLLIMNDTRVFNATLIGKKEAGTAKIDVLLLKKIKNNVWECLVKPGKRLKPGHFISFAKGKLRAKVLEKTKSGEQVLKFFSRGSVDKLIQKIGKIPLPPYIKPTALQKKNQNLSERYQTVYAKKTGASAAPTAGLHFTKPLLQKLKKRGVKTAYVTLHTSAGTFRPVFTEYIEQHKMFAEYFEVSKTTEELVNKTKKQGGRVVAVGTTSVRSLEASAGKHQARETDIFIRPGYGFKIVDAMITNFHFPKSTLLMLVSAFANKHLIRKAYKEAVKKKYRFFSFGDAMLII